MLIPASRVSYAREIDTDESELSIICTLLVYYSRFQFIIDVTSEYNKLRCYDSTMNYRAATRPDPDHLPSVNWLLHIFLNSQSSAPNSAAVPISSTDPQSPATNIAAIKWSSVPWASRYLGTFINIVIARRRSGPEFFVIASSNSCRKSSIVLSGGDSIAKLSERHISERL